MWVYKCKKIKINWLSLFDVASVYEFRTDHLVLDNLLGGSSLPLLAVINCLYLFIKGWCPVRFPPSTLACLLVLSLFRSWLSSHMLKCHGRNCCCNFQEIQACRRLPGPLVFTIFPSPLPQCLLSLS